MEHLEKAIFKNAMSGDAAKIDSFFKKDDESSTLDSDDTDYEEKIKAKKDKKKDKKKKKKDK